MQGHQKNSEDRTVHQFLNDLQLWELRQKSREGMTLILVKLQCLRFEKQGGCEFACKIVTSADRYRNGHWSTGVVFSRHTQEIQRYIPPYQPTSFKLSQ